MSRDTDPLVINVATLRRRLGQVMTVPVRYLPDDNAVVASRPTGDPVTGTVVLDSIERGVTVKGTVDVEWMTECRRCLEVVTGRAEAVIDEIFQIGADEGSDLIPFDGEHVDLRPVLRDATLAALPLSALCRDECVGPDPERYRPGIDGVRPRDVDESAPDEDDPAPKDPRWAVLDELDLD